MDISKRLVAAVELVLIFPAALFLTAVVARQLQPMQYAAQQVVTWYSGRLWTLWILLIILPLAALFIGCVTLLAGANARLEASLADKQSSGLIRAPVPTWIITVATVVAGLILMVVAAHMLAN